MKASLLPKSSLFEISHRLTCRSRSMFLLLLVFLAGVLTHNTHGQLLTDDFTDGRSSPVTSKDARITSADWSGTNLHISGDATDNESMGNIGLNHVYYLTMVLEEGYEMSITSIIFRTNGNGPNSFQIKVNDENYGAAFPAGSYETTTTTAVTGKLRKVITIQLAVSNADFRNWTAIDNFIVNGSISDYDVAAEAIPDANGILYVDRAKTHSGNGGTWENALSQVHYALKVKDTNPAVKQIWVAKGEYQPSSEGLSFAMRNDVKMYGGFNGDESAVNQRKVTEYKTTLKGRGSSVIHNTNINNTALLDGFSISGGSGYAARALVRFGAGMYNENSSPVIANCIFADNASDPAAQGGQGGGMYNVESNPTILQCIFINNQSQGITYGQGGGLFNVDSSPIIRNCLFTSNTAIGRTTGPNGNGAAIANDGSSSPVIENTIIWNNPDSSIPSGFSSISTLPTSTNTSVVSYSLIQGGYANGNHIIDADPVFTDASGGNYQQTEDSPVIDAGNPSTDLTGFLKNASDEVVTINETKRVISGTIDLGPFETHRVTTWYVDAARNAVNPDGKSWEKAFPILQSALSVAFHEDQIWVAKGQYQPVAGESFLLVEGITMYGGFDGDEADPSERSFRFSQSSNLADCTVLLGNGNSVIYTGDFSWTVTLDGFTIKGGNAAKGGGLLSEGGLVEIQNCAFISNTATDDGGALYQKDGSSTFYRTIFTGNRVTNGGGGAVSVADDSYNVFLNCIFNDNSALRGGVIAATSSFYGFLNCTFYGNSSVAGETVYSTSSEYIIQNSIMHGNSGGILTSGGKETVEGSLVQGRGVNKVSRNLNGDIDPQFVDPANGNFHLLACSPAINRAINFEGVETIPDFAGNPRAFNQQIDMGAFEMQHIPEAKKLMTNAVSTVLLPVYAGVTPIVKDCETVAFVEPIGSDGVNGDILAQSYIESGQTLVSGTHVFVKRHFDLTPIDSPGKARITLFFTKQEFDAYNQAYGNTNGAALPANLKIVQYHGSSASGLPGTYSGTKEVITDLDVTFDSVNGIYSVAFDVTGFSGFFASGQSEAALPVNLISLKASEREGKGYLEWATSSESNSDQFEVERSGKGKLWETIGRVRAQGNATAVARYFFLDEQPLSGENLYRLKMIDRAADGRDGTYAYSRIVNLHFSNGSSPALYPNPAVDQVKILNVADSQIQKVEFYDNAGKILTSQPGPVNGKLNIFKVPSGIYTVKLILLNNESRQLRLVIAR